MQEPKGTLQEAISEKSNRFFLVFPECLSQREMPFILIMIFEKRMNQVV